MSKQSPLKCQMSDSCCAETTHIDEKGFVYCENHGKQRKQSGIRSRKLTPKELKQLKSGLPLSRY